MPAGNLGLLEEDERAKGSIPSISTKRCRELAFARESMLPAAHSTWERRRVFS
jgi:hypothetical protein